MDSIYMNNYRGFSNTVVPLRPVTFLVGENSTGKTSFIALVELLAQTEFWFGLDFNAGAYEFGGYRDIVSVKSDNQDEFQIGICKHGHAHNKGNVCYLLHFREAKDGVAELARFSQLSSTFYATIRVSQKQVAALIGTDVPPLGDCSSPQDCFRFLMQDIAHRQSGYKVYKDEDATYVRQAPVANAPMILHELFKEKEFKGMRTGFPFPALSMSFESMAPIRTTPKRTYDGYTKRFSSEGEHTPYVIRRELPHSRGKSNAFKKALEEFGRDSGLFQSVGVTQFGSDSAAPFELTVTLSDKALRVNSVGYGVSQVLPIVVELLTHGKNSWLAVQQPEVHLHPKAQAALGDVLFHASTDEFQTLFIETHSDYLLDRFRICMRENDHPPGFAQVVFFQRSADGNDVCPMEIDSTGEYPADQPPGFRSFFLAEQKRILGV